MSTNRVVKPAVPYVGCINTGNFGPGKSIRIQGLPLTTAYRFYINLQCGPENLPKNGIALQIAINVLEGCVTLNSLENKIWDEAHRGELPLGRGKMFDILISCDFNRYKITVDDEHYIEFPQRICYNRITHLKIHGDLSIFQISYGEMGGTSGNGLSGDDFEEIIIDTMTNTEIYPTLSDSFTSPYEVVIESSKRVPYPKSDPMGIPRVPSNRGTNILPYPLPVSSTMHSVPTSAIIIASFFCTPTDTPTYSLNSQPELSKPYGLQLIPCCIGVIFGIICIIVMVIQIGIVK